MARLARLFPVAAAAVLLAGCGLIGGESAGPLPASQASRLPVPRAAPTAGAIYAAGGEVTYFEDLKARRVGDLITILLQEATNATKTNSTKTKKDTTVENAGPTIAGRPVTVNGTEVLNMGVGGSSQFQGEGSSSQSNQLQGSLTAVVIDRLPNGNLVVQGEKWLQLNQGEEFVRLTGVVRAADVLPDNTVTSDKVADARISYGGRGAVSASNRMGWLARFFNSALVPF